MKPRRILVVLIVALAGLFLWFFLFDRKAQEEKHDLPVKTARNPSTLPSSPATSEKSKEPSLGIIQNFIKDFATPITFYGKVIDQHGMPVPNADIIFRANDSPFGGKGSQYQRQTDANGFFSISGIRGLTLGVEVSKTGYYAVPPAGAKPSSSGVFEYGLESTPFNSSKDAPVVFILYKQGPLEPLVKVGKDCLDIARDGTPLAISLNPADRTNSHQVVIRCWTKDLGRPAGQQHYDWHLEISVPFGGLTKRTNVFATLKSPGDDANEVRFEAPEAGYQSQDVIDMPATLPSGYGGWASFAVRSYFVKFNDGTYARADMEMHAGGDHFVIWKSYFNPMPGSRNLEADPKDR